MYDRIPVIMSCKECQKIMRIGKTTLLKLIHSGEIEAFRVGRRWKIPRESVIEYIKYKLY